MRGSGFTRRFSFYAIIYNIKTGSSHRYSPAGGNAGAAGKRGCRFRRKKLGLVSAAGRSFSPKGKAEATVAS